MGTHGWGSLQFTRARIARRLIVRYHLSTDVNAGQFLAFLLKWSAQAMIMSRGEHTVPGACPDCAPGSAIPERASLEPAVVSGGLTCSRTDAIPPYDMPDNVSSSWYANTLLCTYRRLHIPSW